MKKFDFVIGNPPYQEDTEATRDKPIYDRFIDASHDVGEKCELITPGRFLFNAGATSKEWNEKILNDKHFKILNYELDASNVFPSVGFKGGVAISYYDKDKDFGTIGVFSIYPELNSIFKKVKNVLKGSLSEIMYGQGAYKYTEKMHNDHPEIKYQEDENGNNKGMLSKGHDNDIATNALDKLDKILFFEEKPDKSDYIQIVGRKDGVRTQMYIKKEYVSQHETLNKYKVILPKANGTGAIGEVLSTPLIGEPLIGYTQTFISAGCYDDKNEAENLMKYIKTKFCRTMLGVLKVTQDNPPEKWKYVPIQNFTDTSDIDWSKSISDIDKQLYKKYKLSKEEIDFIESHVKEMD